MTDNTTTPETAADDVFARVEDEDRDSGADFAAPETSDGPMRDDRGRFASREAADANAQTDTDEPQVSTESPTHEQPNRHVPLAELLEERNRYKSERQLREEAEIRLKAYESQLQALQAAQRPAPQPQPQQVMQPPDMFEDPQGYHAYMQQQTHFAIRNTVTHQSERFARKTYGDDVVNKAFEAAQKNPRLLQEWAHQSPDPYGDMVEWYRKEQALAEVGTDLEAFKKRIADEAVKKALEGLKQGQPQPRFPGSLAGATATGTQGGHLSPQAAADSVFMRREA